MRQRSTWSRTAHTDPSSLTPGHVESQPAADAYDIGTPADFGEEPSDSTLSWKADPGRNEIGMGEFRGDTFNGDVIRKASLAVKVARAVLGSRAAEASVEDQAVSFMDLSESTLLETFGRIASEQQDEEEEEGQAKQAQQDQGQQEEGQAKQAQQDQGQQDQGQAKQAQQDQGQQDQGQAKQAQQQTVQALQQAIQSGDYQTASRLSQLLAQAQGQQQMAQGQQQMPFAQQQQMPQGQQQMPQGQQQMTAEQQLEAELAELMGQQQMPQAQGQDFDIELDGSQMGLDDVDFGAGDQALQQIFASQEQDQQGQGQSKTASRVGTRPSTGVAVLGSAAQPSTMSVDALSNLWRKDPDVSGNFR